MRIDHLKAAIDVTPRASEVEGLEVRKIRAQMFELNLLLRGDQTIRSRAEPTPWGVATRASSLYNAIIKSQSKVSGNHLSSLSVAEKQFELVADLLTKMDQDLRAVEKTLDSRGAPWTPGKVQSNL